MVMKAQDFLWYFLLVALFVIMGLAWIGPITDPVKTSLKTDYIVDSRPPQGH